MTDASDHPDLADVRLDPSSDDRWTLVFVRRLRHAPERVWQALVDPAQLAEWAPFDAPRDLSTPGPVVLTMAGPDGGPGEDTPSEVLVAEPPVRLEYRWGDDLLRWDLAPADDTGGTVLTLHHTIDDHDWAPRTAAGWHLCLDVAERMMGGERGGRVVGDDAKEHGWDALRDAYEDRLGA